MHHLSDRHIPENTLDQLEEDTTDVLPWLKLNRNEATEDEFPVDGFEESHFQHFTPNIGTISCNWIERRRRFLESEILNCWCRNVDANDEMIFVENEKLLISHIQLNELNRRSDQIDCVWFQRILQIIIRESGKFHIIDAKLKLRCS